MDGNSPEMSEVEILKAQLAAMQAERDALKAERGVGPISMKVSEKGGVSVYGLGRFPVTLYGEQWPKLLAEAPRILKFIEENKPRLSTKEQAVAKKAAAKEAADAAAKAEIANLYETVPDGKGGMVTRRKVVANG